MVQPGLEMDSFSKSPRLESGKDPHRGHRESWRLALSKNACASTNRTVETLALGANKKMDVYEVTAAAEPKAFNHRGMARNFFSNSCGSF